MHLPAQPAPRTRVVVGAVCGIVLSACGGHRAQDKSPALWELDLTEPVAETIESPWGEVHATHRDVLARLGEAADDDQATGILLHVGELRGAWARADDLASAIERVRKANKPVHCHAEATDNLGYALMARVCDRLSLTPGGVLNLVGPRIEVLYAHELLQLLGVSAELIQIGRYKGAAESFTRSEMTPELRETLEQLVDQFSARLVTAVSAGRSLDAEQVRSLIDRGPFDAHAAREARLVDAVAFDDEAREHARRAAKAERVVRVPLAEPREPPGLVAILRALRGSAVVKTQRGERLVVAYLDGTILQGDERQVRSAHAVPFVAAMRRFADDEDVRAVVLRIDSPGGSALASDLMWHAVRRVEKRKPVIVSIGDMAASGGYYVASAGSEILARDTSLVGSIGVVGGKVVFEDLARRVGVKTEGPQRGRNAGWTSPFKRLSDDERAALTRLAQSTYSTFIGRVAHGRKLSRAEVQRWAEGRLMSGARAREARLVDREGGLEDAIARARELAKLDHDDPVEVWPGERSFVEALSEWTGGGVRAPGLGAALWPSSRLPRSGLVETLLADEARVAAVLPWLLSID